MYNIVTVVNATGLFTVCQFHLSLKKNFLKILFIFREGKGRRKRGRETCVRETAIDSLSRAPNWRPGLQPRHVPRLVIKPTTF